MINERKIRSASRLLKYSLSELRDTKNQFDTYNEDFLSAVEHVRRNLKKEQRDYGKFKEQPESNDSGENSCEEEKTSEETTGNIFFPPTLKALFCIAYSSPTLTSYTLERDFGGA